MKKGKKSNKGGEGQVAEDIKAKVGSGVGSGAEVVVDGDNYLGDFERDPSQGGDAEHEAKDGDKVDNGGAAGQLEDDDLSVEGGGLPKMNSSDKLGLGEEQKAKLQALEAKKAKAGGAGGAGEEKEPLVVDADQGADDGAAAAAAAAGGEGQGEGGEEKEVKDEDEEVHVEVNDHNNQGKPKPAERSWRPWAPRQPDTVTARLTALLAEWKASAPQIVEIAVQDQDGKAVEHVAVAAPGEGVGDEGVGDGKEGKEAEGKQAEQKAGSRRGSAHMVRQEVVVQFDEAKALAFIKRNFNIVEVPAEAKAADGAGAGAAAGAEAEDAKQGPDGGAAGARGEAGEGGDNVDAAPAPVAAQPLVTRFSMKAYPDIVVDPALVFGLLDKYKFNDQFNVELGADLKATEFSGERFFSKGTLSWLGITAALVLESAFAGTTAAGSQIEDFRLCPMGDDFSWNIPSLLGWIIPAMSLLSILGNIHNTYTYGGTPRSGDFDGMVKVIQGRIAELVHDLQTMGVPVEQAKAFAEDILLFAKKADGILFSRKGGWTEIRALMSLYNKIVLGMAMMILMVGGGKPIPDTFHLIGALFVGFLAGLIEGADASWGPFYMGQTFQEIYAFIKRGILPPLAPEREATGLGRLAKNPLLGLILAFNGPFVLGIGRATLSILTNWQQLGLVYTPQEGDPVDTLGAYKGLWAGLCLFSVGVYMKRFRELNLEHNLHHLMPNRDLRNVNEDNWSRFAASLIPAGFLTGGLYGGLTGVLSNIEAVGYSATYLSLLAGISLKALPDAAEVLTGRQKAKQFAQSVVPHMVNLTASLYIGEAMGATSGGDAAISSLMFMIVTAVMMAVPVRVQRFGWNLPTLIGGNYFTKKILEPVLTLTVPCGYMTLAESKRPSLSTRNLAISGATLSTIAVLLAVGADLSDIDNTLVTLATASTTYLASMTLSAILFRKSPENGLRIPYIPGPGGTYYAAFVDSILKSILKLVVGFSGGNVAATSETLLNPDGLGFVGSRVAAALLPIPAIAAAQADASAFVPVILADHKHLDDQHVPIGLARAPSVVGQVGAHQVGRHEDRKENGDEKKARGGQGGGEGQGFHGVGDGDDEDGAGPFHALPGGEDGGPDGRRRAQLQIEEPDAAPGGLQRLTSSLADGAHNFGRAMSGYWRHGLHRTTPLIPASRSAGGTVRAKAPGADGQTPILGKDKRLRPVHDQQRRVGADVPLLGYGSFHGSQQPTPAHPGLQGAGGPPRPVVAGGAGDDNHDLEAPGQGGGEQPALGWRAKMGGCVVS